MPPLPSPLSCLTWLKAFISVRRSLFAKANRARALWFFQTIGMLANSNDSLARFITLLWRIQKQRLGRQACSNSESRIETAENSTEDHHLKHCLSAIGPIFSIESSAIHTYFSKSEVDREESLAETVQELARYR